MATRTISTSLSGVLGSSVDAARWAEDCVGVVVPDGDGVVKAVLSAEANAGDGGEVDVSTAGVGKMSGGGVWCGVGWVGVAGSTMVNPSVAELESPTTRSDGTKTRSIW